MFILGGISAFEWLLGWKAELHWKRHWQLLVGVSLSAQYRGANLLESIIMVRNKAQTTLFANRMFQALYWFGRNRTRSGGDTAHEVMYVTIYLHFSARPWPIISPPQVIYKHVITVEQAGFQSPRRLELTLLESKLCTPGQRLVLGATPRRQRWLTMHRILWSWAKFCVEWCNNVAPFKGRWCMGPRWLSSIVGLLRCFHDVLRRGRQEWTVCLLWIYMRPRCYKPSISTYNHRIVYTLDHSHCVIHNVNI